MKLKRQTSTTATPTYPATLEYGDLAVANNGVPAFGDKDNLPVPLGTAAEIKQINSSLVSFKSESTAKLLTILAAMKNESETVVSAWYPASDYPDTTNGFWVVRIVRGTSVGYSKLDATYHNGNNTIIRKWHGTYAPDVGTIDWLEISSLGKLHILSVIAGSDGSYPILDMTNYNTIVVSLVRGNSIIGNTLIPKDIFVLGSQHITNGQLSFADTDFKAVAVSYIGNTSKVAVYFKHQGTYDCVIYGLK